MFLLIDKGRAEVLQEILDQLILANDKKLGRVRASVTTSREIIDFEAKDQLAQQVEKSILEKKNLFGIENEKADVLISHKSNPDILGGVIIRIGDYVLDGSVRTFINKWKKGVSEHKMSNERGWQ